MNHFRFNSYLPTLSSISDVIKQMELLQAELESSDLRNLRFFNRTYLLITLAVQNKLGAHFLDNDQRMVNFDIAFAKYYFDALREYCLNKQIAPAWQQCFESARSKKLPHTIYGARSQRTRQ